MCLHVAIPAPLTGNVLLAIVLGDLGARRKVTRRYHQALMSDITETLTQNAGRLGGVVDVGRAISEQDELCAVTVATEMVLTNPFLHMTRKALEFVQVHVTIHWLAELPDHDATSDVPYREYPYPVNLGWLDDVRHVDHVNCSRFKQSSITQYL